MAGRDFDVAVVGASTAGCTAARLYAQRGAKVALIEKRPDPDAYKTVCTHFIQSSATPTIEKLGLAPLLEDRGAIHNSIDLWTTYSGWIPATSGAPYGFNITRQRLDPALRKLAAETSGVELMGGWTTTGLLGNGRPSGVRVENSAHTEREISADLVVGADGRGSDVARFARVPGRVKPHGRFFYWAYWKGIRPPSEVSRMWLLEPDAAYLFPNEGGLDLLLVAPHRDRLPDFKAGRKAAYLRLIRSLPDGPDLRHATMESKLLGKLDLPNVARPAAKPGVAFVGDAALAGDPLWGIGCGWAFQSADWLVEETGDALAGGGDLDAALDRYRRVHRRRLLPHHFTIADYSSGRPASLLERRLWKTAARDERVRPRFEAIGSRRASPLTILSPRMLAGLVRNR